MIKLGNFIGLFGRSEFAIGQGNTSVHWFGALTRGLADEIAKECAGIGLGMSAQVAQEALQGLAPHYWVNDASFTDGGQGRRLFG